MSQAIQQYCDLQFKHITRVLYDKRRIGKKKIFTHCEKRLRSDWILFAKSLKNKSDSRKNCGKNYYKEIFYLFYK